MRKVFTNARLVTLADGKGYDPVGGALAVDAGIIQWLGPHHQLPPSWAGAETVDLGNRLVTPALVDCHTHLVYAGNRAAEFEQRLQGVSYEAISRAGGGIRSTVTATRAAPAEALLASATRRLDDLLADGVGTVEVKSGYGLDLATERKMLQVARALGRKRRVRVVTTFLGAHAIPWEYQGRSDAYIDLVCEEMLPALAAEGLVDAVDGFCESIAFSPAQMARVFSRAQDLGLPVKLHADQLSDGGGGALAARFDALSADHLEYLSRDGVAAMAKASTVAVLLPGAFYTLREQQLPPVAALREAGVPMAVATDANPGSSPLTSLLLAMNMACTLFRLTPEEALRGTTAAAAKALGLWDTIGTLAPGKACDCAVWAVETPAELSYGLGQRPLQGRIAAGEWV
ncbi:MAG: imidazolonepropionase [Candidatus Competibacterales bacterium]